MKQKIPVTAPCILLFGISQRLFFRHTDKFIRCQSVNECYHIANLSTDMMKNAPDHSKSTERCCGKIPATQNGAGGFGEHDC
ncbi:addiction module toxin RelE [Escherichia coli]|nr:addiction module toxin RelE [Escherichia coli]KZO62882.1 toxin RelE [Escherichia coli]PSZ20006.1 addiction module toxin RelE [Escherichia sp. 4726-5]